MQHELSDAKLWRHYIEKIKSNCLIILNLVTKKDLSELISKVLRRVTGGPIFLLLTLILMYFLKIF